MSDEGFPVPRIRHYRGRSDAAVITAYFNPQNYRSRLQNLTRFLEPLMGGGVDVTLAEGVFDNVSRVPANCATRIIKVTGCAILWQKERLLNIALSYVPRSARYIAWLDCDVLFSNPFWLVNAADELSDRLTFGQPFGSVHLCPAPSGMDQEPLVYESFASVLERDGTALSKGRFEAHGHTGFAWVGRADVLRYSGFYDKCISGSGDHVMAHAMTNTPTSPCVSRLLGTDSPLKRDFVAWAQKWKPLGQRSIGYVPGAAYHLWHGHRANRRYMQRNKELFEMGFDPRSDIDFSCDGCFKISPSRPDLVRWATEYFKTRAEDG
jgi:hypothetical protein